MIPETESTNIKVEYTFIMHDSPTYIIKYIWQSTWIPKIIWLLIRKLAYIVA